MAEIEIQFNWVMVVIAGALIFLFFFGIVNWAKKGGDEATALTISNYLDSILTSASVTKQTVNTVTLPFKEIEFSCDGYRVDGSANQRNIRNKILFSPSKVIKNDLITWSLSWDVPYRAMNFLYITSPQVRYIIKGDTTNTIYKYLEENLPETLNVEFSPDSIVDKNNYKVRFIYVNVDPLDSDLLEFKKELPEDITALKIVGNEINSRISLTFYQKNALGVSGNPTWRGAINNEAFGTASLIAAIFSESQEYYQCNMDKAFQRLSYLSDIYLKRAEELLIYYQGPGLSASCNGVYAGVNGWPINNLITSPNFNNLVSSYNHLTLRNKEAQEKSCALIY